MHYRQEYNGEPFKVKKYEGTGIHKISCCDCGLVHRLEIENKRDHFEVTTWRDERATAAKRRNKKFKAQ